MQEGDCALGELQVRERGKDVMRNKYNRHVSVLNGAEYMAKGHAVKRCRKTQHDCFANFQKKQIFQLLHAFVNKLLQEDAYLQQVIHQIQFDENPLKDKIIVSDQSINSSDSADVFNENVEEINDVQINVICVDRVERKEEEQERDWGNLLSIDNMLSDYSQSNSKIINKKNINKKSAKSTKKISIMLQSNDLNFTEQAETNQHSSTLFSEQSLFLNTSSIEIIQQQLTMEMVEAIYEQPQPFLINLSVCLMLKYLHRSKTSLDKKNVCWILSIGTIVAYKLYYDEPVEGLMESFAQILKLSKQDIVILEMNFLKGINHEAVISSQQYHSTLYHIIKSGKQ